MMRKGRPIGGFLGKAAAAVVLAFLAPIATGLYSAGELGDHTGYAVTAMEAAATIGAAVDETGTQALTATDAARIDSLMKSLALYSPTGGSTPEAAAAARAAASSIATWEGLQRGTGLKGVAGEGELRALASSLASAGALMAEAGMVESGLLRGRLLFLTVISLAVVAAVSVLTVVRVTMPLARLTGRVTTMNHGTIVGEGDGEGTCPLNTPDEFAVVAEGLASMRRSHEEARDEHHAFLNSLPMAVFEVGSSGEVCYFNTAGARLAALSNTGLSGLSFMDLLDTGSKEEFPGLLMEAAALYRPASTTLALGSRGEDALVVVNAISRSGPTGARWAVCCACSALDSIDAALSPALRAGGAQPA